MNSGKVENGRKKRRVVNVVELGDGELVYIRLDDGKKYLLNGDGCWRCGSTAKCFGNMDDNELEVVCEFDFYDEVKSLFLLVLQDRVVRIVNWLNEKIDDKQTRTLEHMAEMFGGLVQSVFTKKTHRR